VRGVLGVAVAIRLAAVAALIFATPAGAYTYPSFFGDGRYAIGRSLWMRGVWTGETLHPRFFFEAFEQYGAGGFNYVLAGLQMMLGPATWSLHVVAIAFFMAGVVACHRLARAQYGPLPGLFVLAALLFLPTWLAWSVTPIKEGFQLLLVALCFHAAVAALTRERALSRRTVAFALALLALTALSTLRAGGIVIVAGSVAAGLVFAVIRRRQSVAVVAAVAGVAAVMATLLHPAVQARLDREIDAAADRHIGHVRTPGSGYKLLDERFYHIDTPATLNAAEGARFLVRSAIALVLVPMPWHLRGTTAPVVLALQALWYGLLVLAAVGAPSAMRRAPVLTVMLGAYVALSLIVIAPNSGNVGTLIRHRDMMIFPLLCLASAGLVTVMSRAAVMRPRGLVEATA
jgi:hypothetical protein